MTPPSQGWQVCCLRRACCCWPYIDILPLQSAPSHIPSLSSSDIFGNVSEHNYVIHLIVDTALRPNECFKIQNLSQIPLKIRGVWKNRGVCLKHSLNRKLAQSENILIFGVLVLTKTSCCGEVGFGFWLSNTTEKFQTSLKNFKTHF